MQNVIEVESVRHPHRARRVVDIFGVSWVQDAPPARPTADHQGSSVPLEDLDALARAIASDGILLQLESLRVAIAGDMDRLERLRTARIGARGTAGENVVG